MFHRVIPIPTFVPPGILPPFIGNPQNAGGYSPYRVSVSAVVQRFSGSVERRIMLEGLLRYRAALHQAGFLTGFQWLDGSFIEEIERLEDRPPGDIDVVSFIQSPHPVANRALIKSLVSPTSKIAFHCDAYFVDLNREGHHVVRSATFWYGLFGHRRNREPWKGLLEIDLDPTEDGNARTTLMTGATA
jgi:hypothetical protein